MATAGETGTPQQQRNHYSVAGAENNISSSISTSIKAEQNNATECVTNAVAASRQQNESKNNSDQVKEEEDSTARVGGVETAVVADLPTATSSSTSSSAAVNKKLLLCRRFKDSGGILRNFNSLPLFVYATSPSTHATSADGVGVAKEAAAAAAAAAIVNGDKNDSYDLALCTTHKSGIEAVVGAIDCLPLSGSSSHHHTMSIAATTSGSCGGGGGQLPSSGAPTVAVVGAGGVSYPHHLNLNHHHHLLGHHSPYSNNYPLHHSSSHHHIHSDQTKSLQELQHEVGALLEFRDLVIETFPDLKHKMASMSSSSSAAAMGGSSVTSASVSGTNTLTGGGGGMSHSSLASRREWEPGIRIKRKLSQKEPSTSIAATQAAAATGNSAGSGAAVATAAGELSSSSLTRSRSNSHSGKKEPKSGENNNGSVVQDSGFSTETSSSKEGHSASSNNGAMTGNIASNRLSCPESDDELLNLLDVIHRKSNRLREEMEHLQNYERQNLRGGTNSSSSNNDEPSTTAGGNSAAAALAKSSGGSSTVSGGLTPKTFREHVERLNKEDIKQLRKERDRLLDKLAEMEAETLTGRIKAAKMNDQVEELISVKKDLEGQLKLAMAQKLELSSRFQQLQSQQSKSSSSQSDSSSQRNFLTSATTVLSTGSGASHLESTTTFNTSGPAVPLQNRSRLNNTFQPVVVEQQQDEIHQFAFHQSAGSDNHKQQLQQQQLQLLGHLDGIVSSPGGRNTKCRLTDSKRFTAILLETSVIELQRHLLTLTVQNQVLMQKLDQAGKSKNHLAKRLDKSKEDVEDLRFQLEEKNIELEGTKAQLRVLESRIHSHTPSSSSATTNSYLHSQNDYETNRSSASTTLMLSRRGLSGSGNDSHYSDIMRSATPTSQMHLHQMPPPPNATQISTPSMKAMVHLPMDEIQHHSSSTESAHDHELHHHHDVLPQSVVSRLMSTSVGGVSPFEQRLSPRAGQQSTAKKFNVGANATASKPSKIPLPGSKAAAYFAGKPPSGRPSTAGRSPPSAHNSSAISNASSKSSLSRSTGNLLYSKSPNSLKRADSAQSIRKELANNSNSSFGTNNSSRSSTSSSIPMATTPYGINATTAATSSKSSSATTPSPRVLQNSPLPKLKRESLTSRVRHLDSLSRVHHHNNHNHATITSSFNSSPTSNASDASNVSVTTTAASPPATAGNYAMISSTPKTSTIAAQLNSALRKDLQLSSSSYSHSSQQHPRRATGAGGVGGTTISSTITSGNSNGRRHSNSATSSSSAVGARMAARTNNLEQNGAHEQHTNSSGATNGGANASDSDSGKVRTLKSTFLGWLKI